MTPEHTLLRERCGYNLEGLPSANPCPECGTPIAESLPGRRAGGPWQIQPSLRARVLTLWWVLARPGGCRDDPRIDTPSGMDSAHQWLFLTIFSNPLPASGLLLGLLTFETLTHLGIRRFRFANGPRPPLAALTSPRHAAPA